MDRKELDSLVTRIRFNCNALAEDALVMPMPSEAIEQAAEPVKIEAPQPAVERMISATPAFTADDLL